MTVPVVTMPNPWKMMLDLLRSHTQLPTELMPAADQVVATLPDTFPAGLPLLQVVQVPGGRRNVPLRLATALFDLHCYDSDLFEAMELARKVAGVVLSLEQKLTPSGGFTLVRLVDEPFPLQDPDTDTPRSVIPVSATYRPR